MLWFFAFTSVGILIYAFFVSLNSFAGLSKLRLLGLTFLMGLGGVFAWKAKET